MNGMPEFRPHKYRGTGTDDHPVTRRWGPSMGVKLAQRCAECDHGLNTNWHYNKCLNLGLRTHYNQGGDDEPGMDTVSVAKECLICAD